MAHIDLAMLVMYDDTDMFCLTVSVVSLSLSSPIMSCPVICISHVYTTCHNTHPPPPQTYILTHHLIVTQFIVFTTITYCYCHLCYIVIVVLYIAINVSMRLIFPCDDITQHVIFICALHLYIVMTYMHLHAHIHTCVYDLYVILLIPNLSY